jgi:phosphoribosylamine-glycine ligase
VIYVVKTNGRNHGKGVFVTDDHDEALTRLRDAERRGLSVTFEVSGPPVRRASFNALERPE